MAELYTQWQAAQDYHAVVRAAVRGNAEFSRFKRNAAYTSIVGGFFKRAGPALCMCLMTSARDWLGLRRAQLHLYLQQLQQYDRLAGGAEEVACDVIGPGQRAFTLNPDILRYIKERMELHRLFGSLIGLDVVEIGGGYGGLGHALLAPSPPAPVPVARHRVVDLPHVLQLLRKVVNRTRMQGLQPLISNSRKMQPVSSDLLLSFYSISELQSVVVDRYLLQYVAEARRGYLQLNYADLPRGTWVNMSLNASAAISHAKLHEALAQSGETKWIARHPGRKTVAQLFKAVQRFHPQAQLILPEPCATCAHMHACQQISSVWSAEPAIVWGHNRVE